MSLNISVILKKQTKRFLIGLYGHYVRRFLKLNSQMKLIGISGSVGKTSTKFAVVEILRSSGKKVLVHEGAYNDPFASMFVLLGVDYPNVQSPVSVLKAFFKLKRASKIDIDYDYAVIEIGTDTPGEMRQFGRFGVLDLCVISAITPEHMVNFRSFDEVVREELEVLKYSKMIVANSDLIPKKYQKDIILSGLSIMWFGTEKSNSAVVRVGSLVDIGLKTKREIFVKIDGYDNKIRTSLLHLHSGFVIAAALLVAKSLNLSTTASARVLESILPAPGRGRLIAGKRGSIIIDDSHNNVGANVSIASLDLLYEFNTPRRIAVLGGINELSTDIEQETHTEVAVYLKEKKLQEVVLIGALAKKYYKPILATSQIPFKWFSTPYKAGNYLQNKLVAGMVVLVKGSQNGIYSEEAIKPLLQDPKDSSLLVRQSKAWIEKKKKSFGP